MAIIFPRETKEPWLLPLISEEYIVEVVVDVQQLLGYLLIGYSGDELHDSLLHGPAGPIQFLGDTCTSG